MRMRLSVEGSDLEGHAVDAAKRLQMGALSLGMGAVANHGLDPLVLSFRMLRWKHAKPKHTADMLEHTWSMKT